MWRAKGPGIEEFEEHIASRAGTDHAVAFNSGTSTVYAALLAHGVSGGEVIVPSFTFQATGNVVVATGAEPVVADIERNSLALNPQLDVISSQRTQGRHANSLRRRCLHVDKRGRRYRRRLRGSPNWGRCSLTGSLPSTASQSATLATRQCSTSVSTKCSRPARAA